MAVSIFAALLTGLLQQTNARTFTNGHKDAHNNYKMFAIDFS